MSQDLSAALEQRNAEHGTNYYLMVNETQAIDIAAGCVPNSVKAMARALLDWAEEDQRKADANQAQIDHARQKAQIDADRKWAAKQTRRIEAKMAAKRTQRKTKRRR